MSVCLEGERNGEVISLRAQTVFRGNKTRNFEIPSQVGVSSRKKEKLALLDNLEVSKPSQVDGAHVSRADSFLDEMRFDVHLMHYGISAGEASSFFLGR